MVVETKSKENMFEKEIGHSFGIYGFSPWGENYPLRKTVVDHNHERIIAKRGWETSDQINGQLLKQSGTVGGNGRECGDRWVGIDLHLLAKGAAGDKAADEGGHTWPPVVPRQ